MSENIKSSLKNIFDTWADSGRYQQTIEGHLTTVNHMVNYIDLPEKSFDFLDIGCGNGWVCERISQFDNCISCTGIDISSGMIAKANRENKNSKTNFYNSDILEWQTDKKFDLVFIVEAAYYFPNLKEYLAKIKSLIKEGGQIVLAIHYFKENIESHNWPEKHLNNTQINLLSSAEWQETLKEVGFKNVQAKLFKDLFSKEKWERELGGLIIKAIN